MADHEEYSDFDFGFTAADEDELNSLMGADTDDVTSEEIMEMKEKLDLILQMNSTCDGANQVKEQYDELMEAKMHEIEQVVLPLQIPQSHCHHQMKPYPYQYLLDRLD